MLNTVKQLSTLLGVSRPQEAETTTTRNNISTRSSATRKSLYALLGASALTVLGAEGCVLDRTGTLDPNKVSDGGAGGMADGGGTGGVEDGGGGAGGMETGGGGTGGMETGGGGAGGNECIGEGDPCDNGLLGECFAEGTLECVDGNIATCNAIGQSPMTEVCDGLDNDCDGTADNNDANCMPVLTFDYTTSPCYTIGTIEAGLTVSDFVNNESTPSGMCQDGQLVASPDVAAGEHTWIWGDNLNAFSFDCVDAFPVAQAKCSDEATTPTRQKMVDDYNSVQAFQTVPVNIVNTTCTVDPSALAGCANGTVFVDLTY